MFEAPELPRTKRRPRSLRELDQRARIARLRHEEQIFRPRLVRQNLRLTPEQLERVDAERRVPDSRGVPSRCAMIRELKDEGLAWRSTMRPKSSGPGRVRGAPFSHRLFFSRCFAMEIHDDRVDIPVRAGGCRDHP